MQHPRWKKLLSYVKEISLEKTSSLSNPYLEVLLVKGRHQLVTKDAIYSYDDKYENFKIAFERIDLDMLPGQRVLLLGLGLGSVIYILERIQGKKYDYRALEVDPEICRMCNTYTLLDLDSFVEVVPQEAMRFLDQDQQKYDLIIMDIFQSAVIPKKFQTKAFLRMLNAKLHSGGLLMYNRMNITNEDQEKNKHFKAVMDTVFSNNASITTKTNIIMLSNGNYLL